VTVETVVFAAVAAALLAASLGVVLTPNLFHAVLYLAAALVSTGVVFLLLHAPFLFGVQLLLYAGGVVTIVVFAIMLTERLVGRTIRQSSRYVVNGAVISLAIFVGVVGFLLQAAPGPAAGGWAGELTAAVGRALVGAYAVPFELLGVLLVVALLGAIYFARSEG
jgi:NADH:ubiquinone oxidoreductase subunit 6 (subunit J)